MGHRTAARMSLKLMEDAMFVVYLAADHAGSREAVVQRKNDCIDRLRRQEAEGQRKEGLVVVAGSSWNLVVVEESCFCGCSIHSRDLTDWVDNCSEVADHTVIVVVSRKPLVGVLAALESVVVVE